MVRVKEIIRWKITCFIHFIVFSVNAGAYFDSAPQREPAVVNTSNHQKINVYGDLNILTLSPDFQPGNEIQINNSNSWTKIQPKKSWEIQKGYFGGTLPRLPGSDRREYQFYQPVHLIDGDPYTCWISRPLPLPDTEPQWVRIDLPQITEVASLIMKARPEQLPERGFCKTWPNYQESDRYINPFPKSLKIEVSTDGWNWTTIHETSDLKTQGKPGESIRIDFPSVRAKIIRVVGNHFGPLIGSVLGSFFSHCWCMGEIELLNTSGENLSLINRGAAVSVSSTNWGYQGRYQEMNDLWPCIYELGVKWLRIGLWDSSLQWHYVEQEKGKYVIDPVADAAITQMAANGITIIMGLQYGNWLYADQPKSNLASLVEPIPFDSPPAPTGEEAIKAYTNFVRFMVTHFKGRVKYWEIWNEPVQDADRYSFGFGEQGMARYLKVFNQVEPLIRQVDPDAKILSAVHHPEVIKRVDAFDIYRLYSVLYDKPQYEKLYRDAMAHLANAGFKGLATSEENQWNVTLHFKTGVSEIGQAKNIGRSLLPHAAHAVIGIYNETWDTGLAESPNPGCNDVGLIAPSEFGQPAYQLRPRPAFYMFRTLCTVTAEAEPANFTVETSADDKLDYYTMAWPDGSKLVAIWLRGKVMDDHPGLNAEARRAGSNHGCRLDHLIRGFDQAGVLGERGAGGSLSMLQRAIIQRQCHMNMACFMVTSLRLNTYANRVITEDKIANHGCTIFRNCEL